MIFLQLFYTFFKIGLFGFGGGYAMLSMIQGEVVTKYGWLSTAEFTDIVAISQMTPGPIGINSATYVGYSAIVNAGFQPAMGVIGSTIATLAVVLPSFILMFLISKFFIKFQNHPSVKAVFKGLRPAIVGLLAAAALLLMNSENFGQFYNLPLSDLRTFIQANYQFLISIIIFIVTFIATRYYKISPIYMIILCGIAGFFLF